MSMQDRILDAIVDRASKRGVVLEKDNALGATNVVDLRAVDGLDVQATARLDFQDGRASAKKPRRNGKFGAGNFASVYYDRSDSGGRNDTVSEFVQAVVEHLAGES